MRVLCTGVESPGGLSSGDGAEWIKIGGEYTVISMIAVPLRRLELQIVGEDPSLPGMWDSAVFVTVDDRIPSNWVMNVGEGGVVEVGPRRWLKPGFWEDYFDREPAAVAVYEEELRQILKESLST